VIDRVSERVFIADESMNVECEWPRMNTSDPFQAGAYRGDTILEEAIHSWIAAARSYC
jgi:hypothetical protein